MNTLDLIKNNNFKFNKKFGQNFIFDSNFLNSLVNELNIENKIVVEIGCGAGTLTKALSQKAQKVIGYEIDENLKEILSSNLENVRNVEIRFEDIMKVNISTLENEINQDYVIVANLPYYITSPIIFKFLENAKSLKSMCIMVQKEVADRLMAKPKTKQYGSITVAINCIADCHLIKNVNRNMFVPKPNVDSAIVRIDLKDKFKIENMELLRKTIKSAFAMRRKTLANNLKKDFNLSGTQLEQIFTSLNIQSSIRGEELNELEFVNLANLINKLI